jgi:MFS family permease
MSSHSPAQPAQDAYRRSALAEREPLLRAASGIATDDEDAAAEDAPPTPLPRLQIALLTYTRVCEPLAFAILFPFVNSMVLNTGEVSAAQVGYYVGLIESCFSFTQMVFLIPWGWAADRFGRKPVLVVSLLGACVSTTLFGLSSKIWQMVLARSIAGLFGGNSVVVRTVRA